MQSQTNQTTPQQAYSDAGLIYIRYHGTIDTKDNGQKKINGRRPAYTKIEKQPKYNKYSGEYYSLLMGREFQPGRRAILLDFDNKSEGSVKSGLDLVKLLDMDQYGAPKQSTPSKGCHYIFYLDAEQTSKMISNSINNITYQRVEYAMDVKLKNQICKRSPSIIEGYGRYAWTKGSYDKLRNIPRLPDELYSMINAKKTPPPPNTHTNSRANRH